MRATSAAITVSIVCIAFALSVSSCAHHDQEDIPPAESVKAILDNPVDDMEVTLQGTIGRKVKHEKYRFDDGTGEITVEIDDDDRPDDRALKPGMRVEIYGEVENNFGRDPEIDVKKVRILSAD